MLSPSDPFGSSPAHSDVLCGILCASVSFESLFASVRTCKVFHSVYKNNAKQILRSVSFNLVGRAFPLALQLARHEVAEDSSTEDSEDEGNIDLQLAIKEATILADNARVVAEWENMYSSRMKNFRSRTSQLTPAESWRFQKAMYRLMMYSRLFPSDKGAYNIKHSSPGQIQTATFGFSRTGNDDLVVLYPELAHERLRRKAYLSDFFSNELHQISLVADFLAQNIKWIDSVDGFHMRGLGEYIEIALSAGPSVVLECYKNLGFEPLVEAINRLCPPTTPDYFEDTRHRPLLSNYLIQPINMVLQERDPDIGFHSDNHAILDSEQETYEPCARCGSKTYHLGLWGETTWDYLSLPSQTLGSYIFPSASTLLKGELSRNPVELQRVETFLLKTPFKEIFQDIFAKGLKLPTYPDKRTDDYWCYSCMTEFTKDHLHLWVFLKRKEAGEKVASDCMATTVELKCTNRAMPQDSIIFANQHDNLTAQSPWMDWFT
ncbi:hypothetical protein D9757_007049 [Collybiopsis confluens]|uniref:Uncharacterized protein n=1 Tax=Collybiopsis confluens TaxID=2823264 RepID=A0A8H5M4K5_9AGAR|nr:hypothetical protein D9757_007049 [Collybiopsis confluens]